MKHGAVWVDWCQQGRITQWALWAQAQGPTCTWGPTSASTRMANLSCTQWKHYTLSYFKTDYYCHYWYLYNFYKSPFKLSDSDPPPGPRPFPGCGLSARCALSLPRGGGMGSNSLKCARGLRRCWQPTRHPIYRLQQVTHRTRVKLVLGLVFGGYSLGSSRDFAEVRPVWAAGGRLAHLPEPRWIPDNWFREGH